ncbi:M14 family zinc carboxypeptidase [Flocculibacter collagenilyticus]|uniref:M14 family zinc carboxypeptidase n=1 Tax=Flocculibacter collagenilyticus TaxID=2744479 RepID=UPI0018F77802|nr:M14 family zinc carboxypeptidase [Flocculibacter collagenilyticus]
MNKVRAAIVSICFGSMAGIPLASVANEPADIQQLMEEEKAQQNIYRAYYPNMDTARKAAISLHSFLLESNHEEGYLILELSDEEKLKLSKFGFRFEIAHTFIKNRNLRLTELQKNIAAADSSITPTAGIPGYSCYETVEESFAAAQTIASNNPTLATWTDVGDSWEKSDGQTGFDMKVLKLTKNNGITTKPKLFINSAIHAREYTTAPLALDFARWLIDGYGTNADATWILNHHEVHLMLQTNPDGRKKAETGLSWRKNTNQNYCGANSNSRGADLNRNFTFTWNSSGGSSGNVCNATYRGPSAGSEPETQAIEGYVRSLWPDSRGPNQNDPAPMDTSGIHIDLHSYSELILWPWGGTNQVAPNGIELQTLGRKFAFFNNYYPQQSIGLYPTDGTSDSVSYAELGVAAFTFELGTSFFQSCSTYENTIKPNNLPALIYAAKVTRTPYITPGGPDVTAVSLAGNASTTGVPAGTPVNITGSASDQRFSNANGNEGTQNLTQAEYYIDVPPWEAGAQAFSLNASDGSFNSKTEAFDGTINTGSLSEGQHIVYVRAKDGSDKWGAISAVFLNIDNSGAGDPVANFTFDCTELACNFDASSSTDVGGNIVSYSWDFGDSSSGTGVNASNTYAAYGNYTVSLTVTDNDNNTASINKVVELVDPSNGLVNGQPITGLSGSQGDEKRYEMQVPADATGLSFAISGGTGDADLYVKFGSAPTTGDYDCRPWRNGNNETCNIDPTQQGTYHVMIRGYAAYSGVTLVGSYSTGGTPGDSGSNLNISVSQGYWFRHTIEVPAGTSTLTVTTTGGSGDADLYLRSGSAPSTINYDCRSWNSSNQESCVINNPAAGTWHVGVYGYRRSAGIDENWNYE